VAGPIAPAGPGVSWSDRLRGLRDRLIADPRFQRWAARFPLTRPVAHRQARALFDLCAGFVYSQVLLACVRLQLFDVLAEGPQPLATLSRRLSLSPDATARLLWAAASLRLAEHRGGDRFGLGMLGAALRGNPGVAAMIEHHALLYMDLEDPVTLLRAGSRNTALGRYWPYAEADRPGSLDEAQVAAYSALMSASQPLVAEEVLDACRFDRFGCLLDVGGGEGTFLLAVAKRAPRLRLMLFDLPAVAARARERFAAAGLAHRATAIGGDFHADPLPAGADAIVLVRVLFDHDDARVLALLRRTHAALPPDGTLLLAEPMSGTPGAERVSDAYFGFYLLAMGRGRTRTPEHLRQLLRTAGFRRVRTVPTRTPLHTRLIEARP
jgi:demethylspheroidene O-methyltransferase